MLTEGLGINVHAFRYYLGYEAAEGLDWVWEHRIDDLLQLEIEP